jgi:hypothetical protein
LSALRRGIIRKRPVQNQLNIQISAATLAWMNLAPSNNAQLDLDRTLNRMLLWLAPPEQQPPRLESAMAGWGYTPSSHAKRLAAMHRARNAASRV